MVCELRSTHLHSGFYPVYRPVGQCVVRHMMVNVSAARRELVHVRASETSTIINSKHESLPHREFIFCFCHNSSARHHPDSLSMK